ncbi:MAG: DUF4278 domain-containing protein [Cyanobacteria bacterium J06634_6]
MKLTYRGVSYEHTLPRIPVADTEETGKYRGVLLHFHKLLRSLPQPPVDLKYRGVSYHKGGKAV